jgi:hypothetical protein
MMPRSVRSRVVPYLARPIAERCRNFSTIARTTESVCSILYLLGLTAFRVFLGLVNAAFVVAALVGFLVVSTTAATSQILCC